MHRLKSGDFGEGNVAVRFSFYTASEDWVHDCGIDVVNLPGYLGIEEKADNFSAWIDAHLPPANRQTKRQASMSKLTRPRRRCSPSLLGLSHVAGVDRHLIRKEEWLGEVTETLGHALRAHMTDASERRPDHESTLPNDAVGEQGLKVLEVGCEFVWTVSLWEDEDGAAAASVGSR